MDKKDDINKNTVRKGMIVISKETENNICYQFSAEVEILSHSVVLSSRYTPVVHCGTIRQSAKLRLKEGQSLKLGDKEIVSFRFIQHPEFVEVGSCFMFREGTTRGLGIVIDILPLHLDPDKSPAFIKKLKCKHKKRLNKSNNIKVV